MRSIDPATIAALGQSVVRAAFLARVEFPGGRRLAFTTLLRNFEYDGDTFIGAGTLGAVTEANSNSDLEPADYSISLSGISDAALSACSDFSYMNYPASAWMLVLNESDQVIGEPLLWFKGLTDRISITYGEVSSIEISVRNRMTDWSRQKIKRYTDGEHQEQYPGDKFFEFVSTVAAKDVEWPADSWFEKNS